MGMAALQLDFNFASMWQHNSVSHVGYVPKDKFQSFYFQFHILLTANEIILSLSAYYLQTLSMDNSEG